MTVLKKVVSFTVLQRSRIISNLHMRFTITMRRRTEEGFGTSGGIVDSKNASLNAKYLLNLINVERDKCDEKF